MDLHAKPPASNAPYRAGKGTLYEGGVRVVAFANWPGKLKPGVVNEPLHMVDVMPTLLALAGGKGSDSHPFDGKDMWPTLTGEKPSPHEDILINVEAFRGAVRKGNWKLIKMATLPGKTELYDLSKDPGEKENVAEQNPEIVRDLEARLLKYAKEQKTSLWLQGQVQFLGPRARPSWTRTLTWTTAACLGEAGAAQGIAGQGSGVKREPLIPAGAALDSVPKPQK